MAPPISKRGIKAVALLKTPHPKDPSRCYTITEAAKKAGTSRSAVYRQIKRESNEASPTKSRSQNDQQR